jgi:hypothetical protein
MNNTMVSISAIKSNLSIEIQLELDNGRRDDFHSLNGFK